MRGRAGRLCRPVRSSDVMRAPCFDRLWRDCQNGDWYLDFSDGSRYRYAGRPDEVVRVAGTFPHGAFYNRSGLRRRRTFGNEYEKVSVIPPTACSVWYRPATPGAVSVPLCAQIPHTDWGSLLAFLPLDKNDAEGIIHVEAAAGPGFTCHVHAEINPGFFTGIGFDAMVQTGPYASTLSAVFPSLSNPDYSLDAQVTDMDTATTWVVGVVGGDAPITDASIPVLRPCQQVLPVSIGFNISNGAVSGVFTADYTVSLY